MKWIRNILKGISLTAAMFVFQACYGMDRDYYDTTVTFHVVADDTGEPIEGVRIWVTDVNDSDSSAYETSRYLADYTDSNGMATIWREANLERYTFIDKDSLYTPMDTILNPMNVDTVDIVLRKLD